MRRPRKPVVSYDGHEDYPSDREDWLSRRRFLGGATVATAGVALLGLGGRVEAGSKQADKRQRVTIQLSRYTQIGNSGLRAQRVDLFTEDKGLARFLKKYSERQRIQQQLNLRLRKVKPKTLYDGRKLYRLERDLGAIITKQYRKRTGKRARQPDVMLVITRYYRYRRMSGVMIRPAYRPRPRIKKKP